METTQSSPTGPCKQEKRVLLRNLVSHEAAQDEVQELSQDEVSQEVQLAQVVLQPRTLITFFRSAPNVTCDSKVNWTEKELKALVELYCFILQVIVGQPTSTRSSGSVPVIS